MIYIPLCGTALLISLCSEFVHQKDNSKIHMENKEKSRCVELVGANYCFSELEYTGFATSNGAKSIDLKLNMSEYLSKECINNVKKRSKSHPDITYTEIMIRSYFPNEGRYELLSRLYELRFEQNGRKLYPLGKSKCNKSEKTSTIIGTDSSCVSFSFGNVEIFTVIDCFNNPKHSFRRCEITTLDDNFWIIFRIPRECEDEVELISKNLIRKIRLRKDK